MFVMIVGDSRSLRPRSTAQSTRYLALNCRITLARERLCNQDDFQLLPHSLDPVQEASLLH